jgi:tRNA threonylcarbamoyladenosine biosynthesis protein TsaB
MRVLALDTTTPAGSIAIVAEDRVVDVVLLPADRPHGMQLPGMALDLLTRTHLRLQDLDCGAGAVGPGSFAGIRIGIACIPGLSMVTGRPVVPVSALEALAHEATAHLGVGSLVAAWIDGRRREVFSATYRVCDGPYFTPERVRVVAGPTVDTPASLVAQWLHDGQMPAVVTGDGAATYRDLLPAEVVTRGHPALAGAIGRFASVRARRGEYVDPGQIQPLYVRRPDVEIAREAKRASKV